MQMYKHSRCSWTVIAVAIVFIVVLFICHYSDENIFCPELKGQKSILSQSDYKEIPWNLNRLFEAPQFSWLDSANSVCSLLYEGIEYKNMTTKIFAYYSTPGLVSGDFTLDRNLPAVVLVHWGWGSADCDWVKLWASRGYAAIAMDLDGNGPDGKRIQNAGPPAKEYMTEVWNNHAIAKIILAHSLIRSFPEVDENKTGITGVSVGGHLTCAVAGIDTRFKAAVPVYGCGYLHEIDEWRNSDLYTGLSDEHKAIWDWVYDPSNHIGHSSCPILFVAGTNDLYYPIDKLMKTYMVVPKERRYLSIIPGLPHNCLQGITMPEIGIFMDSVLSGCAPLPSFSSIVVKNHVIMAQVSSRLNLTSAYICFTTDKSTYVKKTWSNSIARVLGNDVVVPRPPEDTVAWYLLVIDSRRATASSRIFTGDDLKKKKLE